MVYTCTCIVKFLLCEYFQFIHYQFDDRLSEYAIDKIGQTFFCTADQLNKKNSENSNDTIVFGDFCRNVHILYYMY